jgi:hypothetical protein
MLHHWFDWVLFWDGRMSKQPLSEYAIHAAADLFPMMSETEYDGLKEDIRVNGQRDPVTMWCDEVIDGRNRLRACGELGIEPAFTELSPDIDPVDWVLSHNLHRRHLTTAQRAMVASNLATLLAGRPGKLNSSIELFMSSQAKAAEQLNVSVSSVKRARRVRKNASKKVIAAVEAGTMSLSAAEKAAERAKVKAEKERKKAADKAAREAKRIADKAAKDAQNLKDKEAQAAKRIADMEAKKAAERAALPKDEQAKLNRSLTQQLIDKAARGVNDLHHVKKSPNLSAHEWAAIDKIVRELQGKPRNIAAVKLLQQAGVLLW